jgi:hypothetical protein
MKVGEARLLVGHGQVVDPADPHRHEFGAVACPLDLTRQRQHVLDQTRLQKLGMGNALFIGESFALLQDLVEVGECAEEDGDTDIVEREGHGQRPCFGTVPAHRRETLLR